MKQYTVTCVTSEEIYVEANSQEEAEELAAQQCSFPAVDYCMVEEVTE